MALTKIKTGSIADNAVTDAKVADNITAGTAATLATSRSINGVSFNGSSAITVTAAAGTLTGNTLASGVTASSLTSVGTIGTGVWQGTTIASAYLDADTAHLSTTQTFSGAKTFTGGLTIDTSADNYVTMTSGATDANLGFLFKNSSDVQKGFILFDSDDSVLKLDSDGDIYLDAGGADIVLLDDGTHLGTIKLSSSALRFDSQVSDQDITFTGNDGGSAITALTLDMSEGGDATFAGTITVGASNGSEEVKANRTRVRHIDGLADASDYSHGDLYVNHISTGNIYMQRATTFASTVAATGNITTDGIFKVDSAPDNDVIQFDQSGRKSALKTYFSSDSTGSKVIVKVSDGNTNGGMVDALDVRPAQATFAGSVFMGSGSYVVDDHANFGVGAIVSNWGTNWDVLNVGHSSAYWCEVGDYADRGAGWGNNVYHNGSNYKSIYEDQVSAITQKAGNIKFYTAGVKATSSNMTTPGDGDERMKVTNGGSILFGTTDRTATGVGGASFDPNSVGRCLLLLGSVNYTSSVDVARFYNDNGEVGDIRTDGSGASFNSNSDYRLKENEVVLSNALTRLNNLKPYRFNFKADENKTLDGFFAHEVQEVVPEAVTGTKDQMKAIQYQPEDEIPEGKEVYDIKEYSTTEIDPQKMDASKLVPLLVAAVQELSAKVTALENA